MVDLSPVCALRAIEGHMGNLSISVSLLVQEHLLSLQKSTDQAMFLLPLLGVHEMIVLSYLA